MARKSVHMFWGILFVLVGAFFGWSAARVLYRFQWKLIAEDLWFLASFLPLSSLATYLVWHGNRQLQQAGRQDVPTPRRRWGLLVLGFWIIFASLKNHFSPGPGKLQPDNQAESAIMSLTAAGIAGFGVVLMLLGLTPRKQKIGSAQAETAADS